LQWMAVTLGESKHLGDFLFRLRPRIKSTLGRSLVVDAKHRRHCCLGIHIEEVFEDMDNKIHGRVVVVQ